MRAEGSQIGHDSSFFSFFLNLRAYIKHDSLYIKAVFVLVSNHF